MHPKTRKAAIALLKTVYFTGKPCPQGHTSVRYTTSSACRDCVRSAKAATQSLIRERFKALAKGAH